MITQNADGLHQRSGTADDAVIELYGNATYAGCLDCKTRHELGPILAAFRKDETLPGCDRCGGITLLVPTPHPPEPTPKTPRTPTPTPPKTG